MIDFSKPVSQYSNFTGANSQLVMSYDVVNENRNYHIDNLAFGYNTRGTKKIEIVDFPSLDLQPGTVLMGASEVSVEASLPDATIDTPTVCFLLEISKEKAWKVLDKINESYSLPHLVKEEQSMQHTSVYFGKNGQMVLNTLSTIQKLLIEDIAFKDYWIDLKIEELVLCCLQTDMRKNLMVGYHQSKLEKHPLAFAIKHIKENLYSQININTLADKAFMSKPTFFRQFKHHFGMTPIAYIHFERIQEAQKLLSKTDKTIGEIGYSLGYNSPSYFSTQFERETGQTPSCFRRSISKI